MSEITNMMMQNSKIRMKVKLTLCLINHNAMKLYCGVGIQSHTLLI